MSESGPPEWAPGLGGPAREGEGGLAPSLGSPREADARAWWRSLKGPIAVLLADLEAANPLVRRRATEALVRLGDRRAVPALARRALDPAWEVREAAVRALARLGGDALLPALHRACRDGHPLVRLAAAEALGQHGDATSLAELEALASHLARYGADRDLVAVRAAIARLQSRLAGP